MSASAAYANDDIRQQVNGILETMGIAAQADNNPAADNNWGSVPKATADVVADVPTQDDWTQYLNNTKTEYAGNVWTDKSVTADESTVLEGDADNRITVYRNAPGESGAGDLGTENSQDATFLTDLSALSSSAYVQTRGDVPLDIVMVVNLSSSMGGTLQKSNPAVSRFEAMSNSMVALVNSVRDVNATIEDDAKKDRLAIVKVGGKYYDSDEGSNGSDEPSYHVGNDFVGGNEAGNQNFTEVVYPLTMLDAEKASAMASLITSGSTGLRANPENLDEDAVENSFGRGFTLAQGVLDGKVGEASEGGQSDARADAQKVVVLFNDLSTGAVSQAAAAVNLANSMKAEGAAIFAVGFYMNADEADASDDATNMFLNALSSNYPSATANPSAETVKDALAMGQRADSSYDFYLASQDGVNTYSSTATSQRTVEEAFRAVLSEIQESSQRLPTTQIGGGSAVTFYDELGAYMEVKDVKGLVYGPGVRSADPQEVQEAAQAKLYEPTSTSVSEDPSTGDKRISYYFDYEVLPVYTVDAEDFETKHATPVNLGGTGAEDQIRVTVTKHADLSLGDVVEVQMPSRLLPLLEYEVRYDLDSDNLPHLYRSTARPAHLFYSSGLKAEAIELIDNVGAQAVLPASQQSREYRELLSNVTAHADAETGMAYFYSNLFDGSVAAGANGEATATFGVSSANHYYYFTSDQPLYVRAGENAEGAVQGTVYGDEDATPAYFVRATLANSGLEGQPATADAEGVVSNVDAEGLWYLPTFYVADELGGAARANTAFVSGAMMNSSHVNPAPAIRAADVRADADGNLYLPKGTQESHHRGHLDTVKSDVQLPDGDGAQQAGGLSQTALNVLVGELSGFRGTEYLGNNGRIAVKASGIAEVSNAIVVPEGSNLLVNDGQEFTYMLSAITPPEAEEGEDEETAQPDVYVAIYDGDMPTGDSATRLKEGDTFKLKHGQHAVIGGLPSGWTFEITQATVEGYRTTGYDAEGNAFSLDEEADGVAVSGTASHKAVTSLRFENEFHEVPLLVVPTDSSEFGADGTIAARVVLDGDKDIAEVDPFRFDLYAESDFDVQTGAVDPDATSLAFGSSASDGSITWTVDGVVDLDELDDSDEESEGLSPLLLTGVTGDEGVRFYLVEDPTPDADGHGGVEFSSAIYEAEIVATDSNADGRLEATVTYEKVTGTGSSAEPQEDAEFHNTYAAATYSDRNPDGSYADGALHLDVSETLRGRDLQGRSRLRFILVDENEMLLDSQGDYVLDSQGERVRYETGVTDFSLLYDGALPLDQDAAEGEAALLSFFDGVQLRSDSLPSYWVRGVDANGRTTYTANLHVIQLQRFYGTDGNVAYLSDAGVTPVGSIEAEATVVLTDDGEGVLSASVDYGKDDDGNPRVATMFVNQYTPATISFGDRYTFVKQVVGREFLTDSEGNPNEKFSFHVTASGDYAAVSPLPGGMGYNTDEFGMKDQWLYTPAMPMTMTMDGQTMQMGQYIGSSAMSFQFVNTPFSQENMVAYKLGDDGVPLRDESGALVVDTAADGSPKHVTERTFTYTVREVGADGQGSYGGTKDGLAYDDSTVANVSVTVTDDGAGHLTVSDSYIQVGGAISTHSHVQSGSAGEAATYTNVYAASADADVPVIETTLYGHDLAADQFSYTVVPVDAESVDGVAGADAIEAAVKAGLVDAAASDADKLRAVAQGKTVSSGVAEPCDEWDSDAGRYKAVAESALFDGLTFYNTDLASGEEDELGDALYVDAKRYTYRVTANHAGASARGYTYDAESTALVTFLVTDDHVGKITVTTSVVKGGEAQTGADAAVAFVNAYDASTRPAFNPSFNGGARIDCFTKHLVGTTAAAGEITFATSLVNRSNEPVGDNMVAVGRNTRAIADGGTSPVAFYALDDDGNLTYEEYGIQFTLAELDKLRHDHEGEMVVTKSTVNGEPVYAVRCRVVESAPAGSTPKRSTLYYMAYFTDNGDGTLSGSTTPTSTSVFENTRGADQDLSVVGIVWVDGRSMDESDVFDFRIEPVGDAPMRFSSTQTASDASKTVASEFIAADGHGRVNFGDLHFRKSDLGSDATEGKVFAYRITQVGDSSGADVRNNDSYAGFSHDSHVEDVYVLVTWDEASQDLSAVRVASATDRTPIDAGDFVYRNVYRVGRSVSSTLDSSTIPVTKYLTGRTLVSNGFAVVLADRDGDPDWALDNVATLVKADAATADTHDGTFEPTIEFPAKFDALNNTYDHTYSFMLYEALPGDRDGRIYDKSRYRLTAEVTDDKLGGLSVEWSAVRTHDANGALLAEPEPVEAIQFSNNYNAVGQTALTTSKRMVGRQLFGDGFTFTARMAKYLDLTNAVGQVPEVTGDVVASATNAADGTVELGTLCLSEQDLSTITAEGYLSSLDAQGFNRANYYSLNELASQGIAYAGLDEGRASWDVVFILTESYDREAVPHVTPATFGYAVNLHVVDNGNGSLTSSVASYPLDENGAVASATATADRQFVNVYAPNPLNPSMTDVSGGASDGIAVWKRTEGRDQAAGEYVFELTDTSADRNVVATGTNEATAIAGMDRVSMSAFNDAAYYFTGASSADGVRFYLRESPYDSEGKLLADRGIAYDPTVYPVRAVVTDVLDANGKPNGELQVKWSAFKDGAWVDEITFQNAYEPEGVSLSPTSAANDQALSLGVTLEGRAIRGSEFSFALYRTEDYNYGDIREGAGPVSTGRNRAAADEAAGDTAYKRGIVMSSLAVPITAQGTTSYKLVQVPGKAGGVSYDATVYDVTATAVDKGDGTMGVTWTVSGGSSATEATFANVYATRKSSDPATFAFYDTLNGRPWKTGEQSTYTLRPTGDNASAAPLPTGGTNAVVNPVLRTVAYTAAVPAGGTTTVGATSQLSAGSFVVTPAMMGGATTRTFTYSLSANTGYGRSATSVDTHVVNVTLLAYDDGQGGISTELSLDGSTRFVREYTADSRTYTLLRASKTLQGWALDALANPDHRFEFGITPADYDSAAKIGSRNLAERIVTMTSQRATAGTAANVALSYFENVAFTQDDVNDLAWDDPDSSAPVRSRTYSYTVREVAPNDPPAGYTYSTSVYTVAVKLTDDGEGVLSTTTTVTDVNGAAVSSTTCSPTQSQVGTMPFVNSYRASGEFDITAEKKLVGRRIAEDAFQFSLRPTTRQSLTPAQVESLRATLDDPSYLDAQTRFNGVQRAGEGSLTTGFFADVDFAPIRFNTDDLPKLVSAGYGTSTRANGVTVYSMFFTAAEQDSAALEGTGVKRVEDSFDLVVRVTDSGSGALTFALTTSSGTALDKLTFVNEYNPAPALASAGDGTPVGEVLSFTKLLSGRTWDSGVGGFTYTLAPSTRTDYSYVGAKTTPLPVNSVSDTARYEGSISRATGSWVNHAATRSARASIASFGTFKYVKEDLADGVELSNGHVRKTFEYELREVMPSDGTTVRNGIAYEDRAQYLQVTVEDDLSGQLKVVDATLSRPFGDTFTNTYSASLPNNESGSGAMGISVTMHGRSVEAGMLSFAVAADANDSASIELMERAGMQLGEDGRTATLSNTAAHPDGDPATIDLLREVVFDEGDLGTTFQYTVSQVAGANAGITYDDTKYRLEITPSDKAGTGDLTVDTVLSRWDKATSAWVQLAVGDDDALVDYDTPRYSGDWRSTWSGTAASPARPVIPFTDRYQATGTTNITVVKQLLSRETVSDEDKKLVEHYTFDLKAGDTVIGTGTCGVAGTPSTSEASFVKAERYVVFEGAATQKYEVTGDSTESVVSFTIDTTTNAPTVNGSVNLASPALAGVVEHTTHYAGDASEADGVYDSYRVHLTGTEKADGSEQPSGDAHIDNVKSSISIVVDIDNQALTDASGGQLNVEATYLGSQDKARFRNFYEVKTQRSAAMQGTAVLDTNRGKNLESGEFSFELTAETANAPMPRDAAADTDGVTKKKVTNAGSNIDFDYIVFTADNVPDSGTGVKAGDSEGYGTGSHYKDFVYRIHLAPKPEQSADAVWNDSGNGFAADQRLVIRVVKQSDGTLSRERYRIVGAGTGSATTLELSDGTNATVVKLADDALSMFEMTSVYKLASVTSSPTDQLTVSKQLDGRPLQPGGFQFVMRGTGSVYGDSFFYGVNGKGVGKLVNGSFEVQTGEEGKDAQGNAIDASGNLLDNEGQLIPSTVKLPAVEFNAPGEYRFVLREDMAANPSKMDTDAWSALSFSQAYYDLTATVSVTNGALSVAWSATDPSTEGGSVDSLTFTNTYDATADSVTYLAFSLMTGRAQVEGGFTYTAASPAGAAWTADDGQADRTVWWRAHNADGAADARVHVVEDAVAGSMLVDRLSVAQLNQAVASADRDSEYAPTSKGDVVVDGIEREVWCVPLRLTQSYGANVHARPLNNETDPDSGIHAYSEYDVTIVAYDDNMGGLSARVVEGKVTADQAGAVLQEKGVTSLSGAAATAALGGTVLDVSTIYFIYDYAPTPTEAASLSSLYDVQKELSGRLIADGEFDFAMTLSSESRGLDVQVSDGGNWKQAPETLHGTVASDGGVSFDDIRFRHAGEYSYVLREVADSSSPGVVFSDRRYRVTATVEDCYDDGQSIPNGTLSQTWKVEELGDGGAVTREVRQKADGAHTASDVVLFDNAYVATTSAAGGSPAVLAATKTLQNRPMTAGWFQFDLTMSSVDFAHAVTNASANVVAGDGDDEDPAETVAVGYSSAAGAGVAASIVTASGAPMTLEYSIDQLESWANAAEPIAKKTVDPETHLATYTLYYTLSERNGSSIVAGDSVVPVGASAYRFTVQVTDNGNGSLSASVVAGSVRDANDSSAAALAGTAIPFVNSYEPAASDPFELSFIKQLTGASYTGQTFTFELIPQDDAPVRVSDGNGGYKKLNKLTLSGVGIGERSFEAMVFTADDMQGLVFGSSSEARTRTFRYTLHEAHYIDDPDMGRVDLNASGGYVSQGVKYAPDQTVEVRVSDSAEADSGKLVVSYVKPTMVNTYELDDLTTVSVPVGSEAGQEGYDAGDGSTFAWMTLGHRDLEAGEFTFELYYADEGLSDANWRTAANRVATGTNEATVINYVETGMSDKDKVRVKLTPTPSRITFDGVDITSAMRGGAREADVYFKMVQNTDNTYAGQDVQTGQRVRHGVALDETVYDVRAHVTDDGQGGLNVEWAAKKAGEADVAANWKPQVMFENSYNAFGSSDVEVYSQMTGRILRPGGLWYRLHMSEGIDEAYDPENSSEYDQMSSNARIVSGTQKAAVPFDTLHLRLSDLQLSMELGTADVDANPVIVNGRVLGVTYVVHMIVTEMDGYTEPSGTEHPWPANVNVVEDVYDVGTVTIDGEKRPGVYYTPADGAQGQRKPTYQVDIAAVDDGDGNLIVTTVYPQQYREDGTVVDGSGKSVSVKAGDRLDWVEFNNAYEPDPVYMTVDGAKDIVGRDMGRYAFGSGGEQYEFTVREVTTDAQGNEVKTVPANWVAGTTGRTAGTATSVAASDGKSGTVTFGQLEYTAADLDGQPTSGSGGARRKAYTYEVAETSYNSRGVTSDSRVRRFTVQLHDNVTDDMLPVVDGTLGVDITPAAGSAGDYEFSFTNTYRSAVAAGASTSPTASGSGLTVTQRMDGALPLNAGDLEYELLDSEGTVVARGLNLSDAADGESDGVASVVLAAVGDGLTFTQDQLLQSDGTYVFQRDFPYTLREVAGSVERETYDETVYPLVARLTDNGRGVLSVQWSVKDSSATSVEFVNSYEPEPTPGETEAVLYATNLLTGRDLSDPQNFTFALRYAALDAGGQNAAVYPAGSGQPLPVATGLVAADGVRSGVFELARVDYTEEYLDQLVADGYATKREPTAIEKIEAAVRGETAKTIYTISYVAQEETGEGDLPAGVSVIVGSCPVTVTIATDDTGVMDVESVAYGTGTAVAADFTNAYNAARDVAFQATETMVGRDLNAADEFTVSLRYANGDAVAPLDDAGEVASDAGGQYVSAPVSGQAADGTPSDAATFAVLRYSSENLKALASAGYATVAKAPTDADPSITYTIDYVAYQSADDVPDYVTLDSAERTVRVTVTDSRDARGTLSATMSIDGRDAVDVAATGIAPDAAAFVNTYDPPYFAETDDETAADVLATAELRGRAIVESDFDAFRYRLTYADGAAVSQPRSGDPAISWVNLPVTAASDTATAPFSLGKLHYTTAFLDQLVTAERASVNESGDVYTVRYLAVGDAAALDSLLPEVITPLDDPCQIGVVVTVTDDGSGLLKTSVAYEPAGARHADFVYAYDSGRDGEGSTTVRATALMSGRALDPEELFFGLDVVSQGDGARKGAASVLDVTGGVASGLVANPAGADAGVASGAFTLGTLKFTVPALEKLVAAGYAVLAESDGADVYRIDLVAYQALADAGVEVPAGVTATVREVPLTVTVTDSGEGPLEVEQAFADGAVTADFVDVYATQYLESPVVIQTQTVLEGRRTINSDAGEFRVRLFYKGTDTPAVSADGTTAEPQASSITEEGSTAKLRAGEPSAKFDVAQLTYTPEFLNDLVAAGLASVESAGSSGGGMSAQALGSSSYAIEYEVSAVDDEGNKIASGSEVKPGVVARNASTDATVTVNVDNGAPTLASVTYGPSNQIVNRYNPDASNNAPVQAVTTVEGSSPSSGDYTVRVRYADAEGDPVESPTPNGATAVQTPGASSDDSETTPVYTVLDLSLTVDQLNELVENEVATKTASDGESGDDVDTYEFLLMVSEDVKGDSLPSNVRPVMPSAYAKATVRENLEDGTLTLSLQYLDENGEPTDGDAALLVNRYAEVSDPIAVDGTKELFGNDAGQAEAALTVAGSAETGDLLALQPSDRLDAFEARYAGAEGATSTVAQFMSAAAEQATNRAIAAGDFQFQLRYRDAATSDASAVAQTVANGAAFEEGGNEAPINFAPLVYGYSSEGGAVNLLDLVEAGHADVSTENGVDTYTIQYDVVEVEPGAGMQPNGQVFALTVTVVDDPSANKLAATAEFGDDPIAFTNTYLADRATYAVDTTVGVTGDHELSAGEYEFSITPTGDNADAAPLPSGGGTAFNDAAGGVGFGDIEFTYDMLDGKSSVTFTYVVHQVVRAASGADINPGDGTLVVDGVTYPADYTMTITVTDTGEGYLDYEVTKSGDGSFTVEYPKKEDPENPDNPPVNPPVGPTDNPTDEPKTTPTNQTNPTTGSGSPSGSSASAAKTGDDVPIAPIVGIGLIALSCAVWAYRARRTDA